MKKNLFSLSIISAALLVSTSINATTPIDPQELTVSGQFAAGKCDVSVSNNIYDLGNIPVKLIKKEHKVWLPVEYNKSKTWTVQCSGVTTMNLKIEDNRANTSTDANLFGLGMVRSGGKIGGYKIIVAYPTVDDEPSTLLLDGSTEVNGSITMTPNDTVKWADASGETKKGEKFATNIETQIQLGSQEDMNGPLVGDAHLDGSATLTFTYGI